MAKRTIPKRSARVKRLDITEPVVAWKLALDILQHIANHPGPPLPRDDLKFLLQLTLGDNQTVTKKQRSELEEMAAIVGGEI